jgi:hypothetical protein
MISVTLRGIRDGLKGTSTMTAGTVRDETREKLTATETERTLPNSQVLETRFQNSG